MISSIQSIADRRRSGVAEMLFLSGALIRQRALAARRDWASRTIHIVALVAGSILFFLIFLGTYEGARTLIDAQALRLMWSIPAWAFLIYLFTDIFVAFGQALGDLYLASDMPLLLTSPLRTSSIVVAKFVGGVVQNEVYVVTFLVPFVFGYLLGTNASWWAYLVALAGVAVFPALLYAVLATITILALRYIPSNKAKETLWLLGAIVPTVFWVASFSGIARASGDIETLQLPPAPGWLPSTWVGNMVTALSKHEPFSALGWLLVLLFATLVACPAALAFISRSFAYGWSESITVVRKNAASKSWKVGRAVPWRSLLRKDTLTFLRTPQLWFSHITSLGFVGYLLVGHRVQMPLFPLTIQLAMVQIGFVAVLTGLNPGMTALSLEHGSAWILRATPLAALDILRAKLLVTWGQTALVVAFGAAALAYGYGFSPAYAVSLIAFALLMALCSICCGLAFDTTFPSFQWENPNAINRGVRMVIPFLAGVAVLLACAAMLGAARVLVHGSAAVVVGLILSALTVAWVSYGTLRKSLANIEALEL